MITPTAMISLFPRATLVDNESYTCAGSRVPFKDLSKYWQDALGEDYRFKLIRSGDTVRFREENRTRIRRFGDHSSFVVRANLLGQ